MSTSINALRELFDYDIAVHDIFIADTCSELQSRVDFMKNRCGTVSQVPFTGETLFNAIKNGEYGIIKSFLAYAEDHSELTYTLLVKVMMMLYLQLEHYHVLVETESHLDHVKHVLDQDDNAHTIILYIQNTMDSLQKFLGSRNGIVNKVCEYVDLHICNGVTLQSTADHFGYNSSYLSRFFKESTGESFSAYVKKHKIRHAKALLANHQLKVYEISDRMGYKDVRHFYRIFKSETGTTPTKYRESIFQRQATPDCPCERL